MDSCPLSPLHDDADDDDGLLCYNADSCPYRRRERRRRRVWQPRVLRLPTPRMTLTTRTCPYDNENDADDDDDVCGDADTCLYDAENDADGDDVLRRRGQVPVRHGERRGQRSSVGDEDTCPYDCFNGFEW